MTTDDEAVSADQAAARGRDEDVEAAWEQAWERDKEAVARAAHDAWMRQKLVDGFADHPWPRVGPPGNKYDWDEKRGPCWNCTGNNRPDMAHHHPDMVPFDQLSEKDKAYDYETGRGAYQIGYAAAEARALAAEAHMVRELFAPGPVNDVLDDILQEPIPEDRHLRFHWWLRDSEITRALWLRIEAALGVGGEGQG